MKIINLNNDIILSILVFLDIPTIYLIRNVSNKFYNYSLLAYDKISYIIGYVYRSKEFKASFVTNPTLKNYHFILKFDVDNFFFKNFYSKANKINYADSFSISSLKFK